MSPKPSHKFLFEVHYKSVRLGIRSTNSGNNTNIRAQIDRRSAECFEAYLVFEERNTSKSVTIPMGQVSIDWRPEGEPEYTLNADGEKLTWMQDNSEYGIDREFNKSAVLKIGRLGYSITFEFTSGEFSSKFKKSETFMRDFLELWD